MVLAIQVMNSAHYLSQLPHSEAYMCKNLMQHADVDNDVTLRKKKNAESWQVSGELKSAFCIREGLHTALPPCTYLTKG